MPQANPSVSKDAEISTLRWALVILFLAALTRAYGLADHWKTNDHYNYGGISSTEWLECLKKTPLSYSWGRLVDDCGGTHEPHIYTNHSPFYLWGIWAFTEIFGEGEWVFRSWMLIFSLANVVLVFLLGRNAWPEEPRYALIPMFFQAFFLSGMYFGTHVENMTELTLTPMLVSSLLFWNGKLAWSTAWACFAGVTGWVGFYQFFGMVVFTWLVRPTQLGKVFRCALIGLGVFSLHMTYLKGTPDWMSFLVKKVLNPEYAVPQSTFDTVMAPVYFLNNFVASHSRLLGPLFGSLALYAFCAYVLRTLKLRWQSKRALTEVHPAIALAVLVGFGGLVFNLIGHRITRVHVFLYVYLMPMWSLLAAFMIVKIIHLKSWSTSIAKEILDFPRLYWGILIYLCISYPFGIYQSSRLHDIINSICLVGAALAFGFFLFRRQPSLQEFGHRRSAILAFMIVGASANFSQVVNYRNEADSEFEFCQHAKEEFLRTGKSVSTRERRTRAKDMIYCRGIPIDYQNP